MAQQPTTFGPKTAQRIIDFVEGRDGGQGVSSNLAFVPTQTITFRNESNETVPAYGCMKLVGAELDATIERYVVLIDKPNNVGGIYIFNGANTVEAGARGKAYTGITKAKYATGNTPTLGQYWGPIDSWEISQTGFPAIQVYGDLENEVLYGRSTDGASIEVKVTPTADVSPGNSVAATIYEGQPPAATTQEIPAVFLDWETGGEQISAGKEATAKYEPVDGVWRFSSAECEGDAEASAKLFVGDTLPTQPSTYAAALIAGVGLYINNEGTWEVEMSASTPA